MKDYEEMYETFWKELIENNKGEIILDNLKRELYDYAILIDNVSKVYDHVTGGVVSKPLTNPEIVKELADEHYFELYESLSKED